MQTPSRRQVCAGTALAGVSWAMGGCAADDDSPTAPAGVLAETPHRRGPPSLSQFREIVGSTVTVDENGSPRSLVLTAIHDHGPPVRRPHPRGQSFTVLLDPGPTGSPGSPILASKTYQASQPALGRFTLFLVPHALPGRDHPLYSATFSRI
jgi:hypothetical protein